jgi:HPr kinase/phosphorylase
MTDTALEAETSVHGTAVIYGESGILILGPSASGKSALALALMARAGAAGAFGALVGDDRIFVRKAHGRLIARGATSMGGVVERRGVGLFAVRHEPSAVVRLAVELSGHGKRWPRMPDEDILAVDELSVPRLALDSGQSACDLALIVDERLAALATGRSAGLGISLEHCAAVHKNGRSEYPAARLRAGRVSRSADG